jgi:initiation factor 1A
MPKNVKGGSKHKKMKNNSNSDEITQSDLILKSGKEQDYGKIEKILGNGRFNLLCNDKITRLGIIRGKMRKRNWVNMGSIVLYSTRDYEKDKVDIIHVYSNTVLKMLEHKMNLNFNVSNEDNDDDDIFTTNNSYEEQFVENIPEKQKTTNEYYNFSDSSEDENEIEFDNGVVDDQFIDDL